MKTASIDYLAQVKKLSVDEQERLLSRMTGKLPKRIKKEKLSLEEAFAIQLELEDEQLQEWRANRAEIEERANKLKVKAAEKLAKLLTNNGETAQVSKSAEKVIAKPVAKETSAKAPVAKPQVVKPAAVKTPAAKNLPAKTPAKK